MSFIHDVIKIEFTNIGYLPNCPYYLISDEEMLHAFLRREKDASTGLEVLEGFFVDYYPCPDSFPGSTINMQEKYDLLVEDILTKIHEYLTNNVELPSWIYSYMMLSAVTYESGQLDLEYLQNMLISSGYLDVEGTHMIVSSEYSFNPQIAEACYIASEDWMKRQPSKYYDRKPTMFGEPHVIKSLRLEQSNIFLEE